MTTTRFAPSPTGYLHIGGLRTALFNWLYAQKTGGRFLLRIEDTDQARNQEAAVRAILEAFEWLGLSNDGEIWYQSRRTEIYKSYIQKLLDAGRAYYCYMSKDELDALRAEQQARGETPRYDGRYRDGKLPPRAGVAPVVRIKAPQEGYVLIPDGVKGDVRFKWKDAVDDFIIARSDGTPTYNFVVAIDDALSGVTDIIRGDDHLSNTPKQIVVYETLGFAVPKFYHVPMINNERGKKLSKRDGAVDVMEYKRMGYLPHTLLNFLVRLGWSNKDQEIFSLDEMKALFDPSNINKSASSYNLEKLNWLNAHYIKSSSSDELRAHLAGVGLDLAGVQNADKILDLAKEKAKTLLDLRGEVLRFTRAPEQYNAKDLAHFAPASLEVIRKFCAYLQEKKPLSTDDFAAAIDGFLLEQGLKMPDLGKPLRLAIFGQARGAALAPALEVIGIDEVTARVDLLGKALSAR